MNPLKFLKLFGLGSRLAGQLEAGRKDWDTRKPTDRAGSLYAKSSYWTDTLTAARSLLLQLPIPGAWIRRLEMKNWKTALGGVATILAVAVKVINGEGVTTADIALVTAAIGLLFAKDHNVTGGTVQQ